MFITEIAVQNICRNSWVAHKEISVHPRGFKNQSDKTITWVTILIHPEPFTKRECDCEKEGGGGNNLFEKQIIVWKEAATLFHCPDVSCLKADYAP